jgi:hypothetical protein
MNTNTRPLYLATIIFSLALLLSACNLPGDPTAPASTAIMTNPTPASVSTSAPLQISEGAAENSLPALRVDVSPVAQTITSQAVEAAPSSTDRPWWESMPQHLLSTLQGYPISEHLLQPQIFVYPLADLAMNEAAGTTAQSLQALLQDQQAGQVMPFLPLYNAAQVLHTQVKYLDFKNGQGVRFLTQYDQGPLPVNNHELLYTYQGLTSDGKYYLAAVLPVNLPGLPTNESMTGDLPANFIEDFPGYLAETVAMLDQQPPSAYTPDLSLLDAMMQSIEIK